MELYRFERLSKENLHCLKELYRVCFNVKVGLEFLLKKYDTISFGVEYLGFLAFEKETNELAGYYGVFPMRGIIDEEIRLVAQSGDTMTHPKHQGKGLFTHLAKITYTLAQKEGVDFVFGFPNDNSYPGFKKKLNWNFYSNINNYAIKTGSLPFDKMAKKFSSFNYIYKKYIRKNLEAILTNGFPPNSIEKEDPSSGFILHDAVFFKYKGYYEYYKIEINQVKCLVKVDGRLWVGDVENCTSNQFKSVLDGLVLLAKKLGCSSVHFSVMNKSFGDKILSEKYKIKSENPVGFISLNEAVEPARFSYVAFDFDTY